jgi:hypothetical protein
VVVAAILHVVGAQPRPSAWKRETECCSLFRSNTGTSYETSIFKFVWQLLETQEAPTCQVCVLAEAGSIHVYSVVIGYGLACKAMKKATW